MGVSGLWSSLRWARRMSFLRRFAEAEAGVDDEVITGEAGGGGGGDALGEAGQDEWEDFIGLKWWEGAPSLWGSAGVHEDGSALECGTGGGHGWVPGVAADVVDDLGAGFDGEAGGGGVVGVDGEDGVRALAEDGGDDGEDAGLFFGGGEGGGVGAGGLAADVEDLGAGVEHGESLGEGAVGCVLGGVEMAAVGEAVGRDVEDAHDDGSRAEWEGAGAEAPFVESACGHGDRV